MICSADTLRKCKTRLITSIKECHHIVFGVGSATWRRRRNTRKLYGTRTSAKEILSWWKINKSRVNNVEKMWNRSDRPIQTRPNSNGVRQPTDPIDAVELDEKKSGKVSKRQQQQQRLSFSADSNATIWREMLSIFRWVICGWWWRWWFCLFSFWLGVVFHSIDSLFLFSTSCACLVYRVCAYCG